MYMDIYSQNKSIYFEYDLHENSEQSDNSWFGINSRIFNRSGQA